MLTFRSTYVPPYNRFRFRCSAVKQLVDYRIYVVSSAPETCCLTVICETQMKIVITAVRTAYIGPLPAQFVRDVVVLQKLYNPVSHTSRISAQ